MSKKGKTASVDTGKKAKAGKPQIEARQSEIHGNGVFAVSAISKGQKVVRYLGKMRSHAEVDELYGDEDETGHTFLFTLNDDWVIDANSKGNVARWINHSCDPNCESSVEEDARGRSDHDKIFIEAIRDIAAGEELTYNYGIVLDQPHTAARKKLWGCRCGAQNCTGTMLQPKKSLKERAERDARAEQAAKAEAKAARDAKKAAKKAAKAEKKAAKAARAAEAAKGTKGTKGAKAAKAAKGAKPGKTARTAKVAETA